jgi:hypothetical protein
VKEMLRASINSEPENKLVTAPPARNQSAVLAKLGVAWGIYSL